VRLTTNERAKKQKNGVVVGAHVKSAKPGPFSFIETTTTTRESNEGSCALTATGFSETHEIERTYFLQPSIT